MAGLLPILRSIVEHSRSVVGAKDPTGRYLYVNPMYSRLFHQPAKAFLGRSDADCFPAEIAAAFREADLQVLTRGESLTVEEVAPVDGELRTFLSVKFPLMDDAGNLLGTGLIASDITAMKRIEEERDRTLVRLQEALDQVKRLEGLLPICSYCRKIRDGEGSWNTLEDFIGSHTDASLTHGICPVCARHLMDEFGR